MKLRTLLFAICIGIALLCGACASDTVTSATGQLSTASANPESPTPLPVVAAAPTAPAPTPVPEPTPAPTPEPTATPVPTATPAYVLDKAADEQSALLAYDAVEESPPMVSTADYGDQPVTAGSPTVALGDFSPFCEGVNHTATEYERGTTVWGHYLAVTTPNLKLTIVSYGNADVAAKALDYYRQALEQCNAVNADKTRAGIVKNMQAVEVTAPSVPPDLFLAYSGDLLALKGGAAIRLSHTVTAYTYGRWTLYISADDAKNGVTFQDVKMSLQQFTEHVIKTVVPVLMEGEA